MVKSNSYIAILSFNYISYFMCWTVVEVDSGQKGCIFMEEFIVKEGRESIQLSQYPVQ